MKRPGSYTAAALEEAGEGGATHQRQVRRTGRRTGRGPAEGAWTPAARRKAERAARRERITLELNAELVPVLRDLAEGLGVSTASAADVLLVESLERWVKGELVFDGYLVGSRSPRYEWRTEVPVNGLAGRVAARLAELFGDGGQAPGGGACGNAG